MNNRQLYNKLTPYMDLAVEAHALLRGDTGQEIGGVRHRQSRFSHGQVTTITILNEEGEKAMGRPKGTYVTLDSVELRRNNWEAHKNITRSFAATLKTMIAEEGLGPSDPILVVGLGNWNATPDALGPKVVNTILVTRHMFQYAPEELAGGLRPVSILAPGVLGITGIETAEIIRGVVDRVKPKLVIAVDALAAGSVDRIASTIQLANTGIAPGSGIGNQRKGINKETMGVPVIAVGVPTVVNAIVIAFQLFGHALENNPVLNQSLSQEQMETAIKQVLGSFGTHLTVTPKEIDELISNAARVIASGLNQALHVAVNPNDYAMYLQ
ncbi:MAG: GPR endopeptidase [Clostridia bacterium]|nr:GPR endopeptidase [Clostridia bacterium]